LRNGWGTEIGLAGSSIFGRHGNDDIRMGKITSFEQQRFAKRFGKRIRKTIAEIQLCRMPASSSKVSVGISCNICLGVRDRLDDKVCFSDEIIKPPSSYGIAAYVDDDSNFDKINGTYAAVRRPNTMPPATPTPST
jgi:hypothetical protein